MTSPAQLIFRMPFGVVAFCLVLLSFFCLPKAMAQVVHAGPWTGYLDGTSVANLAVRDSMLFVTNYRGTARVDPITHEYEYFRDMGVADLPYFVNLDYAALDAQGRLWFLEDSKLMHLDPNLTLHEAGDAPTSLVTVMRFDQQDRLWAGFATPFTPPTTGEALARFNGTEWEYVNVGVPALNVQDIAFDGNNYPWFITFARIYRFNGSAFEVIQQSGSNVLGGDRIAISNDGRVAVAGSYNTTGLKYFDKFNWISFPNESYAYPVFDADHVLWTNDRFGNVYRLNPGDQALQLALPTAVNYRSGEKEFITGLGQDENGALWIGKTIGLFKSAQPSAGTWDFVQLTDLLVPGPHPVIAATGDTAWLLTDAGVTRRIQDVFEKLTLPQEGISTLYYDEIGKGLWVGSPGKLGFYHGENYELINIKPLLRDSINNTDIYQLSGDKSGNIWVAVRDGLLRYTSSGQWKTFFQGQELPQAPVGFSKFTFSYTDQSLWIRINGFSTKTFTVPPKLLKISGDLVTDTHFDQTILSENDYFGVVSDSVLWFNSSLGVVHYDHGEVTEYSPGTLNAEEWIIYNDSTALLCSNFGLYVFAHGQWHKPMIPTEYLVNDGALPACLTEDGHLYLANFPLLIVEDIDELLEGLVTAVEPTDPFVPAYFPNPVADILFLDPLFISSCTDCSAVLISGSGGVIRKFPAPLPDQLDLHDLMPGMYFLRMQSRTGVNTVLKLVKTIDN